MKQIPAIIAALVITGFVGLGIFAIGANAYLNTNTVPIQDSPVSANASVKAPITNVSEQTSGNAALAATDAQLKQYQALLKQYQDRERQYQAELNDAAQKLKDANSNAMQYQQQVQVYQNLFMQLQQAGIIQVDGNGNISVPRRRGFSAP